MNFICFRCAVWRGELLFLGSECGRLHVWNASTLTELESIAKHTGTLHDGSTWLYSSPSLIDC